MAGLRSMSPGMAIAPHPPDVPDYISDSSICCSRLLQEAMPDIKGAETNEIEERDGRSLWTAPALADRFENTFQSTLRFNFRPAESQHRKSVGIAAGNFRDPGAVPDLPVGPGLAPVQGFHGVESEPGIILKPEPGMGMRGNGNAILLP